MVVPTEDNAVTFRARTPLSESSRVYMIYFQNNTPARAELATAKPRHANLWPNAPSVTRHERIAEFLCYRVFPWHYSVSSSMRRELSRLALMENWRASRSSLSDAVRRAITSWSSVATMLAMAYLIPRSWSSAEVPERREARLGGPFCSLCCSGSASFFL